ncbi:MAG: amino acid ABC transporter ATP-binding protein [Eubacteriales bacterium]|nr:amino acid ABC transporter ATP-binding protein [Eubacteriales bacterium]MDY3940601.1 amino acid ABC transporter ATP-binding protein [Eubacteriales bacterium]
MGNEILKVENFRKRFGQTEVLKGIDFSMEKSEVLVIIGSSGSGKTTLLRCLNFLETPDAGKMTVGGEVLFDASSAEKQTEEEIRQRRLHFGLVFQSFNLFPQYSVLDNVTLAPMLVVNEEIARDKRLSGKAKKAAKKQAYTDILTNSMELLQKVGLFEKAERYPCELSGGQCQRVAIARALALSPDILCFDEPTSALDPELTGEVLRVIRSLKDEGRTMIVVTHEMAFARAVADKVIYMADGVIEETGTPDAVFGNPQSEKTKNFLRAGGDGTGSF